MQLSAVSCFQKYLSKSQKGQTKINSDCNGTRTRNHLVRKRTLNHLAKNKQLCFFKPQLLSLGLAFLFLQIGVRNIKYTATMFKNYLQ